MSILKNEHGRRGAVGMLQVNNLARRMERRRAIIDAAVKRVIDSGWFILGPEVTAFEQRFASFLGARHSIGLANGTDAIQLALRAAGVRPGDRVAAAANAGLYATTAILALKGSPLFIDVDPSTYGITTAEVRRAVGAGAKAVVATHLYGLALPNITEIADLCRASNVPLIEDCAQAHGATLDGRHVGTFGTAASFSFYPTKNLGALGDGGCVVTNDDGLAALVKQLRQYGWASKYTASVAGALNSRLDELQAAVLSALLPALDGDNARRRAIAAHYSDTITAPVTLPPARGPEYVAHLYVLRTERRDSLRRHLQDRAIGTDIHYPIPDHRQPVFGTEFAAVQLSVTEMLADEVLTLPCYPEMTDEEVQRVIDAVNGWPS